MHKETIFISQPAYLSLDKAQLMINLKEEGRVVPKPIEDLAFVVLEHPQITLTQQLLGALASNNVAVICCNKQYHPIGSLIPFNAHTIQSQRFALQLATKAPLKKQLWKRTIRAKIKAQATALAHTSCQGEEALLSLVGLVQSWDISNVEGRAARYYWPMMMGSDFYRIPQGPAPNHLLNYGYSILRAAMARALAGHGLHNTLGIKHRNKYNAFCLADDMMEPYRPFMDILVYRMEHQGMAREDGKLPPEQKQLLLSILTMDAWYEGEATTVGKALSYTAYSLVDALEKGQSKNLKFATYHVPKLH